MTNVSHTCPRAADAVFCIIGLLTSRSRKQIPSAWRNASSSTWNDFSLVASSRVCKIFSWTKSSPLSAYPRTHTKKTTELDVELEVICNTCVWESLSCPARPSLTPHTYCINYPRRMVSCSQFCMLSVAATRSLPIRAHAHTKKASPSKIKTCILYVQHVCLRIPLLCPMRPHLIRVRFYPPKMKHN